MTATDLSSHWPQELARGAAVIRTDMADSEGWRSLAGGVPQAVLDAAWASANTELSAAPVQLAAERLADLRSEMRAASLDGVLVPLTNDWLADYTNTPAFAMRLQWLTGFHGTVGMALVLADRAFLVTHRRYEGQVPQVDTSLWQIVLTADGQISSPLFDLPELTIGYDPWLHNPQDIDALAHALGSARLVATLRNPVDAAWRDRPPAPIWPVRPLPLEATGVRVQEKLARLRESVGVAGADALVLHDPCSVCWLLNIRGGDVAHTPLVFCRAILPVKGPLRLFIDGRKLTDEAREHLAGQCEIHDEGDVGAVLDGLAADAKFLVDPGASVWFSERITAAGGFVSYGQDPSLALRATKNAVETAGARAAHAEDAAAMIGWLYWLDQAWRSGQAMTESQISAKLRSFRAERPGFLGGSFDTICAAGLNGAVLHYRAGWNRDRLLAAGDILLVDSGGHYRWGTTDITRAVAMGCPSARARADYTHVLRAHVRLAMQPFPHGTYGIQLDAIARGALWQAGRDYWTVTGHGVGSYLAVHEPMPRAAKTQSTAQIQPGMVMSIEPGCYRSGEHGIRIENLVIAVETAAGEDGTSFMAFEPLTLVPFERSLIDTTLLERSEITWIDRYHRRIAEQIGPLLPDDVRAWLLEQTRPLERGDG